ncbi:DUF2306 domain-containing protein [Primorskyibacter sp. 2E107]|uniref:DUF2306 domain-containing protein n=1 Tax=Primorskyibacter sp. 2E107 TaxID=3403458 RepID=UPI003AF9C975
MTFDPILTAPLVIQIHAAAATLSLVLGPVALLRKRRDRVHRLTGYTWVMAMALTALSSFGIHGFGIIGPLSPLHLLAVLVLFSLWQGMRYILAGNVAGHRATMQGLYWRGVVVAGLFNFLPGRTVSRMVLPDAQEAGYWVIAFGLLVLLAQWWFARKNARPQPASGEIQRA